MHHDSCEQTFAAVEDAPAQEAAQEDTQQLNRNMMIQKFVWQASLERTATALSLTIATLLYIHLFASAACYMHFPWTRNHNPMSSFNVYTTLGQHLRGWNKWSHTSVFNNPDELRFAVNYWLVSKDKALDRFGPIEVWDVSLVEDMSHLFEDAVEFEADLSNWDVRAVKNMSNMFRGTNLFAGNSIQGWNTSLVVDFSHMFENSAFNADLSAWDVRAGKSFDKMFHNCSKLASDFPLASVFVVDVESLKGLNESLRPDTGGNEAFDDDLHSLEKSRDLGAYDDDMQQIEIRSTDCEQNVWLRRQHSSWCLFWLHFLHSTTVQGNEDDRDSVELASNR